MFGFGKKSTLPTLETALKGRAEAIPVPDRHFVNGNTLKPPYPEGIELAMFGLGCFWGAEKAFWKLDGVYSTAVGYAAGLTPNPTYQEVCSGMTGHNEVVRVVFNPAVISYAELLKAFWESHNPLKGCAKAMMQAPNIALAFILTQPSKRHWQTLREMPTSRRSTVLDTAPLPLNFWMHLNFILQKSIISNI
jgi:Peptide methionine sulfoxide reductase